jgi:hypothetical protein
VSKLQLLTRRQLPHPQSRPRYADLEIGDSSCAEHGQVEPSSTAFAIDVGAGSQLTALWEPAHGEIIARARATYDEQDPGSRAYASSGLLGAEWWVAATATGAADSAAVDLHEVKALYTHNGLWSRVFDVRP